MRLKAPTMSASGDEIALAIDVPQAEIRPDSRSAPQAGLDRTQATQSLPAQALPDGLVEKAHGDIFKRLQANGYSREEIDRIAHAASAHSHNESHRGVPQGFFISKDGKSLAIQYEKYLTELDLPPPAAGVPSGSQHRSAGATQVSPGVFKEVDAQGGVSFSDRPASVDANTAKAPRVGPKTQVSSDNRDPDTRYARADGPQSTVQVPGGKARAQAQIDAIREDGTGVRVGGAKFSLAKAEVKAAYGETPIAGGKQNMAAMKKSAGIAVSIGEPCKGDEVALSPWSWKWIEKKLGAGDGPAKASASVQGPGVSVDPACVDPAKVVRRTAAEFADTVINNSGFLGNTVKKINDRSDWINSEIEKGTLTQTQPKK